MTQEQILDLIPTILIALAVPCVLYGVIHFLIQEHRRNRNRNAPVFTERATVYHRHEETTVSLAGLHSTYVYYVTFHTDFGQALTLYMTRDDFFILHEGDTGLLTWQGEKFWKFVPEEKEV